MDQIKIGKYIQNLRKEKEMTQLELAEKLCISHQAVSKWEKGETLPDASIILELCEILDTNADLLLHGGTYFMNNRRLLRISDILKGFEAIKNVKKYFGSDSLFYIGMVEGINKKMNMDLEDGLNNHFEVMVAEVVLQAINSGSYYVDIKEVKEFFTNEKMIKYIEKSLAKLENL